MSRLSHRPATVSTVDLAGKTALVTGSSRGLGAGIARQLAAAGSGR